MGTNVGKLFATTKSGSSKMFATRCISFLDSPIFMGYIKPEDGPETGIINLNDVLDRTSMWTVVDDIQSGNWRKYSEELDG